MFTDDEQAAVLLADGDVPVPVGAVDHRARRAGMGEQARRRMTVGVVRTDADEGDGRGHEREQGRVVVGRAVVSDLDEVERHVRAHVRPRRSVRGLLGGHGRHTRGAEVGPDRRPGVLARVGEEEAPHRVVLLRAVDDDVEDERSVIRRGCPRIRGSRPADDRGDIAPPEQVAPDHLVHRAAVGPPPPFDAGPDVLHRGGRDDDVADGTALREPGQPGDVIGVEVGEDDRVDDLDGERVEAPVESFGIGPDIEDDGTPRARREDESVPLSDVAHDDGRGRTGEPGAGSHDEDRHEDCDDGEDGDDRDHRSTTHPSSDPTPHGAGGEHDDEQEDGQGYRAHRACGPRDGTERRRLPGTGEARDAEGGDGGRPGDDDSACGPERGEKGDCGTEEGDRRDERAREGVREDADDADLLLQQDDDRRAHDLRGEGDRKTHGHRAGQPQARAQRLGPRTDEDEEACRREDRQGEAEGSRQPGVDGEQHEEGAGEGRQAEGAAGPCDTDEAHGPHDRRAQDARVGAREDDEAREHAQPHEGATSARDPHPATHPQRAGDDEGAVRARDGGEVGHAGGTHRLGEVLRDGPTVSDDHRGDETARVVGQWRRGRPHGLPHDVRGGHDGAGASTHGGAAEGAEHRPHLVSSAGLFESTAHLDDIAPPDIGPLGLTEHEDGRVDGRREPPGVDARDVDDDGDTGRPWLDLPEGPGFPTDASLEDDGGPFPREVADGPGLGSPFGDGDPEEEGGCEEQTQGEDGAPRLRPAAYRRIRGAGRPLSAWTGEAAACPGGSMHPPPPPGDDECTHAEERTQPEGDPRSATEGECHRRPREQRREEEADVRGRCPCVPLSGHAGHSRIRRPVPAALLDHRLLDHRASIRPSSASAPRHRRRVPGVQPHAERRRECCAVPRV
ncbi:hypothetical protein MOPEL_009_01000 [Mobilicoccus pelagius NBRC 104925]|uniref:Uncharacterized protein n=1 Tax=Mobilicoccus pelagius NBRC 104925 TaxID=1089455 RepID=H5UNV1_9MICO|nr:hypothetical protein MOPEL_009_01000 [Mobilicoccus pelagius NBRC 104925]